MSYCSDLHSEAMVWIKKWNGRFRKASRSIEGKDFQNFEMQNVKIASVLNKINQNSHVKKKVCLEEQKAQQEDRFLRERQIAHVIYDCGRVIDVHDTVLDYVDLFSITLRNDNVLLSMTRIP